MASAETFPLTRDPLRVLHVGKYFPPEPGGMERFLDALSLEQSHRGLRPALLVHDRTQSGMVELNGRPIYRCRSYREAMFTPIAPTWPLKLRSAITGHRPDLLHLHLPNPAAFAVLLSAAARRLPWVIHWHADIPLDVQHRGLQWAYPSYARFESSLLRRARAIIATSRSYLQASTALAAHADRCRVVPLALQTATPGGTPCVWPGPGLRVLAVGRLSYYKGFDRLIQAVAEVEEASLVIAGSGDQATRLQRLIDDNSLSSRIRICPGLSDADIEASYQACDVVCLPSIDRAEAFGLVLLEAMRAARPVIASRVAGSGMSEVVQHDATGLQVEPGSVSQIAEALRLLERDPALRQQLGRAGAERHAQLYRLDLVGEAITRIYHEVVAGE